MFERKIKGENIVKCLFDCFYGKKTEGLENGNMTSIVMETDADKIEAFAQKNNLKFVGNSFGDVCTWALLSGDNCFIALFNCTQCAEKQPVESLEQLVSLIND